MLPGSLTMSDMRQLLVTIAVAVAVTVAVGLLTAVGWPGYLIGAALARAWWVMCALGGSTPSRRGTAALKVYAGGAAFAVVLGYVFFRLGGENAGWWAPAFIMTGALFVTSANVAGSDRASGATSDQR
jgi:hypothetical protein